MAYTKLAELPMNNLVLSLFPGIGLLDMAFEQEGYCIVRGPDLLWGGDIHRFHPPSGVFQGIIGGPPCPDFSPLRYLIAAHGYKSRHGNLIPEFERCISEAKPDWFLMEESVFAPDAIIDGYAQHGFFLCPTWLGEEQSRKRKFCFGVKAEMPIDLRQFIDYAAFGPMVAEKALLADGYVLGSAIGIRKGTVYSTSVNNSPEAKGRIKQPAVTHHANPYTVSTGGSGKIKSAVVTSRDGRDGKMIGGDGSGSGRPRRSWAESCHLQGLPEDFLKDAPFTLSGKREVLGNGVPLPMGRAVARAVKRALCKASEIAL